MSCSQLTWVSVAAALPFTSALCFGLLGMGHGRPCSPALLVRPCRCLPDRCSMPAWLVWHICLTV